MTTSEIITSVGQLWLAHAAVGLVLASPILVLGRTRARWELWELTAFVFPFAIWMALMFSPFADGKSLANLGECIYISLAIPVCILVRWSLGASTHRRVFSAALLATLCGIALAVFVLTPPLPE